MAKSGLSGSSEAMKVLKNYEKDLFKKLQKELNSELAPIMSPIESEINSQVEGQLREALPGMFHNGRSGWAGVTVKARTSVRPRELIFIQGDGRSGGMDKQYGFNYAELAGIERRPPRQVSKGWGSNSVGYHSYIYNGQGKTFNRKLTQKFGKPGRFLWIRVLKRKPEIEQKVMKVAESLNIKLSRKLSTEVSNTGIEVR